MMDHILSLELLPLKYFFIRQLSWFQNYPFLSIFFGHICLASLFSLIMCLFWPLRYKIRDTISVHLGIWFILARVWFFYQHQYSFFLFLFLFLFCIPIDQNYFRPSNDYVNENRILHPSMSCIWLHGEFYSGLFTHFIQFIPFRSFIHMLSTLFFESFLSLSLVPFSYYSGPRIFGSRFFGIFYIFSLSLYIIIFYIFAVFTLSLSISLHIRSSHPSFHRIFYPKMGKRKTK